MTSFTGVFFSQECEKVLLSGKVVDTLRPQNFYNLMVVNRTTGKGHFGMPNGGYNQYVNDGDSITFSIKGYKNIEYKVKADGNCQAKNIWYIEMKPQEIEEVVVYPLKSLQEIQEERAGLAMRETRQVTGIEVLQSPITALYQAFSQKEKNKRLIASYEYADKQKSILQELLRLYVAYDIFYLSETEFDAFISFLNINEDFLKTATEMELVTFVKDKFYHFQLLNKR
jgi:hypothetical protein|tara:strand:- start:14910 stop:15590 length:681 start_codon:yes stop_codon:yes gene_type:complete